MNRTPRSWFITVILAILLDFGTAGARAEFDAQQIARIKAATGLFVIRDRSYTAFCVSDTGLFLTGEFNLPDPAFINGVLVLNPSEKSQKTYPARIYQIFRSPGAVLIKVELDQPVPVLKLGDDSTLALKQPLTAFGYRTYSETHAKTELPPPFTAQAGVVNALQDEKRKSPYFKWEAMLQHGFEGAPLMNDKGEVMGMVRNVDRRAGLNPVLLPSVLKPMLNAEQMKFVGRAARQEPMPPPVIPAPGGPSPREVAARPPKPASPAPIPAAPVPAVPAVQQELRPELLAYAKSATAFIVTPESVLTAFCVSPDGYFVTAPDTSFYRANERDLVLVLDPAGTNKKRHPVRIVRKFETRVALLKVEVDQPLPALQVNENAVLPQGLEVTAIGYPRSRLPELNGLNDPTISAVRVKVAGTMQETKGPTFTKLDGSDGRSRLGEGYPGGPLLDANGQVVGIVTRSAANTAQSVAFPASHLSPAFQSTLISVDLPKVLYEKRFDPAEFVVSLKRLRGPLAEDPAVTLEITSGSESRTAVAKKGADQKYRVSLPPRVAKPGVSAAELPIVCRFTVAQPDSQVLELPLLIPPPRLPKAAPGAALAQLDGTREFGLPAIYDEVVPADEGRVLIFRLPSVRKLAVFDVLEMRFRGFIDLLSDPSVVAGGSRHILIGYLRDNVIERYSVDTLAKERSIANPLDPMLRLVMGHSSSRFAIVATQKPSGPNQIRCWDAVNMSPADRMLSAEQSRDFGSHSGGAFKLRVSGDGRTYAAVGVTRGEMASSFGSGSVAFPKIGEDHRILIPNRDGREIFAGTGQSFSPSLIPIFKGEVPKGAGLLPSYHTEFFLAVPFGMPPMGNRIKPDSWVALYQKGSATPVVEWEDLCHEMSRPSLHAKAEIDTPDKRYHFHPQWNRLVTLPYSNDRIVIRPLDGERALKDQGRPYLYVTSAPPAALASQPFTYQLQAASSAGGVTFKLASGPEGLAVSPSGAVTWTAPASPAEETIILEMKDDSGQTAFHTFKVNVVP